MDTIPSQCSLIFTVYATYVSSSKVTIKVQNRSLVTKLIKGFLQLKQGVLCSCKPLQKGQICHICTKNVLNFFLFVNSSYKISKNVCQFKLVLQTNEYLPHYSTVFRHIKHGYNYMHEQTQIQCSNRQSVGCIMGLPMTPQILHIWVKSMQKFSLAKTFRLWQN